MKWDSALCEHNEYVLVIICNRIYVMDVNLLEA